MMIPTLCLQEKILRTPVRTIYTNDQRYDAILAEAHL